MSWFSHLQNRSTVAPASQDIVPINENKTFNLITILSGYVSPLSIAITKRLEAGNIERKEGPDM